MLTITQALGDFGKLLGGFFGEELSGFFGIQAFRISEGSAQPSPPDDLDAPFFEGEKFAIWVCGDGSDHAQQLTEIIEMRL